MSDSPFRRSINLDGEWEFITDPTNTDADNRIDPEVKWPENTRTVDVPAAWQEFEEFYGYTGRAWYRRSFNVDDVPADRDAVLHFGAVDYEATVWMNGERVGHNEGGYLPFEFDVTDTLEGGTNTVVVAVTDPEDISEIPHGKQGDPWYTRVSGIWQSVELELRPQARVTNAKVTPDLATDTAIVELDVQTGPHTVNELDCHLRMRTADDTVVTTTAVELGESAETVLNFENPDYWHPDSPTLYELEAELSTDDTVVDQFSDFFGFRSFETDGQQFLLNGEPITMRGVLEQGYYPDTLYHPPGPDTFEKEIAAAKELGFNLIRKHVKPAHPDFLAAADRMGILVWEEAANPTLYTDASRAAVRDQMFAMVERDYNHPSVVVWSLYNEEWGFGHTDNEETLWTDESKHSYLHEQYRNLRERDPTRLVCDNSGWAHVATDINDFHRYFASPDRAETWSADLDYICHHPGDNYATRTFDDTEAPVVLSELGTWGLCDIPALREHYGGDPPWFDHNFLTPELKRAAGVDERFRTSDLPNVFGDYETLADVWQRREYISLKHILEEVRTHEEIAGFVLTELSDIEWEFNGILDYQRERKNFYDEFAAVNAPIAVVADPDCHAVWAGDDLSVDIKVINDTGIADEAEIKWSLADRTGATTLMVPAYGVAHLNDAITLPVPEGEAVIHRTLTVSVDIDDRTVSTTEPITVVPSDMSPITDATVFAEGPFASRLARRGISVTHDIQRADIAVIEQFSSDAERFVADGGVLVHVPGRNRYIVDSGPFDYHSVPERESWTETASFFYTGSDLLSDFCHNGRLGWAFEDLYPFTVATGLDSSFDEIHAGYIEGWLANWGGPLVTRPYGDGSVTALTFRVHENYADHPVATSLVDRLLVSLAHNA